LSDKQAKGKQATNTKEKMDKSFKLMKHCDTHRGTNAFMQWLNSEDKKSITVYNPITLKEFVNNKYTVLYDNILGHDIIVETHDGITWCKSCNTDDCGHV
jgi:hypothetical protein